MNETVSVGINKKNNKIIGEFEISIGHPIQARRPDLIIVNKDKKTWQYVLVLANHGKTELTECQKLENIGALGEK